MRYLLLLALLTACSHPPETYDSPTIGMNYTDFLALCGSGLYDKSSTVSNTQGSTLTVTLEDAEKVVYGKTASNRSETGCIGKFIFVNGKLDTISR